jgi:hypothetical protein
MKEYSVSDAISKIKKMLVRISETHPAELDCDSAYKVMDVYAEYEASGADPVSLLPLVKEHLDSCRDCCEEYEALLRVLEANIR